MAQVQGTAVEHVSSCKVIILFACILVLCVSSGLNSSPYTDQRQQHHEHHRRPCTSDASCADENSECYNGECRGKNVQRVPMDVTSTPDSISSTIINSEENEEYRLGLARTLGIFMGIPVLVFIVIGIVFCCVFCPSCPFRSFQKKKRLARPKGIVGFSRLGQGSLMKYGASQQNYDGSLMPMK